jgi:hypothetical protein
MKNLTYIILSIIIFTSCEKYDIIVQKPHDRIIHDTIMVGGDTVIINDTIINIDTTIVNIDTIINNDTTINIDTTLYEAKYDWISTTEKGVDVTYPRLNIFVTTDSIILQFVFADKYSYSKYSKFEKGVDVFSHTAYHTVNGSYEGYTVIDSTRNYLRFLNAGDPNTIKFIVNLETDTTIVLNIGKLVFTLRKPELIFTKK